MEGSFDDYGSYQTIGDLLFRLDNVPQRRGLSGGRNDGEGDDLLSSSFLLSPKGVKVNREYFCSHPDEVCVFRFTTSGDTSLLMNISLNIPLKKKEERTSYRCEKGVMTMRSYATNSTTSLLYQVQASVLTGGLPGECSGTSVIINNPRDLLIVLSAASDYDPSKGDTENGFTFRGEDPQVKIHQILSAVSNKTFETLRTRHEKDFSRLYNSFQLKWNTAEEDIPTDDRVKRYRNSTRDNTLELLQFNFGRYLLISSSRSGTLPANLQGLWANDLSPAWSADYHTDINLQMNYWIAHSTGLSETFEPVVDYITQNWLPRGRETARIHYNSSGFVAHEELNIFGSTGPRCCGGFAIYPLGATWMMSYLWDHFDYTQNDSVLKTRIFPLLKMDYLSPDEVSRDGTLVHYPCQSPEHGNITFGCTHSQHLIGESFHNLLKANQILKDEDESFYKRVKDKLKKLDKGLRIGRWGQLQEWKEDWDSPSDTHRHVSHLVGVWPGYLVRNSEEKYMKAAEVSLIARGDGVGGTAAGWEKVWRAGLWAALRNSSQAHKELSLTIRDNMRLSLLSLYVPSIFQIDANLGYPAAVLATIFQDPDHNYLGRDSAYFILLPALPIEWHNGEISGVQGRGGYTLSYTWKKGQIRTGIHLDARKVNKRQRVQVESDALAYHQVQITGSHRLFPCCAEKLFYLLVCVNYVLNTIGSSYWRNSHMMDPVQRSPENSAESNLESFGGVLRPPPGMKIQHLPKGIREYVSRNPADFKDYLDEISAETKCKEHNQETNSAGCRELRLNPQAELNTLRKQKRE
ncbi:hypothetical protein PROFUN_03876 [Planoprotostelium fungivorum]|uniref:Uncharacterized protein n=1 Tax=Planoprotostelium fungivorum TaxID=1890364 RepID=A0A2P6MTK7_9EUKA|nr:hypothetical protein PROFUN_03876 [Planoprotostelium fungivorum]